MHLVKFHTVDLIDNDAEDETGFEVRDSTTELLSGAIDQLGDKAYFGSRTIRRRVTLNGRDPNTIEYNYQQLVTALGRGRSVMRARDREGVEYVTFAKLVDLGRIASVERYNCEQPLVLRWKMDYPYWVHAEDVSWVGMGFTAGMGPVACPKRTTGTISSLPTSITITTTGTAPRNRYGHLTFVPQAGDSIGQIELHNRANGMVLRYTDTITENQVLVLDFLNHSARLDGENVFQYVTIPSVKQVDWMWLELGENEIEVNANALAGSIDYSWAWARHYL